MPTEMGNQPCWSAQTTSGALIGSRAGRLSLDHTGDTALPLLPRGEGHHVTRLYPLRRADHARHLRRPDEEVVEQEVPLEDHHVELTALPHRQGYRLRIIELFRPCRVVALG